MLRFQLRFLRFLWFFVLLLSQFWKIGDISPGSMVVPPLFVQACNYGWKQHMSLCRDSPQNDSPLYMRSGVENRRGACITHVTVYKALVSLCVFYDCWMVYSLPEAVSFSFNPIRASASSATRSSAFAEMLLTESCTWIVRFFQRLPSPYIIFHRSRSIAATFLSHGRICNGVLLRNTQ